MKVMPIRYSSDVEAMTRFYEVLGLRAGPVSRPGGWAGFEPGPPMDEGFGHSMRVQDPDGVWVQLNRYDRDLYT